MKKINHNFFYIIPTILLTVSCSMFSTRKPASEQFSVLTNFYNEITSKENLDLIHQHSENCHIVYQNLYQKIFSENDFSTYFDTSSIKTIDDDIQTSFEARIALKEAFKNFSNKSKSDQQCLSSVQDIFKALRYIEDYLIQIHMEKIPSASTEYISMKGDFPYFLINPKYAAEFKSYQDLKSGDVILSRGNAYSSAAIARIANSDYQFSHLSFVYRDPETSELATSEAHIEIGSVTAPFEEHLNEKNVRSVIFRYKNPEVAHNASQAMYSRIKKQQETGKNIDYDFSMNYKDDSKLFCSEIISSGFKQAMPEENFIPKFKSTFSPGMIPFLNTIGVPVTNSNIKALDVFAPGDVQFDPDFDLVAEWRNPKKLEESRFKDFILTKLFDLMENHSYVIDPNLKMDIEARAFWIMRRMPIVKKFLEKKFSLSMNLGQMELFMALDKIGDAFYKNLELRSIEFDHPMIPKEIYAALDEFVAKDLSLYEKYKKTPGSAKPAFHLLIHP